MLMLQLICAIISHTFTHMKQLQGQCDQLTHSQPSLNATLLVNQLASIEWSASAPLNSLRKDAHSGLHHSWQLRDTALAGRPSARTPPVGEQPSHVDFMCRSGFSPILAPAYRLGGDMEAEQRTGHKAPTCGQRFDFFFLLGSSSLSSAARFLSSLCIEEMSCELALLDPQNGGHHEATACRCFPPRPWTPSRHACLCRQSLWNVHSLFLKSLRHSPCPLPHLSLPHRQMRVQPALSG